MWKKRKRQQIQKIVLSHVLPVNLNLPSFSLRVFSVFLVNPVSCCCCVGPLVSSRVLVLASRRRGARVRPPATLYRYLAKTVLGG